MIDYKPINTYRQLEKTAGEIDEDNYEWVDDWINNLTV